MLALKWIVVASSIVIFSYRAEAKWVDETCRQTINSKGSIITQSSCGQSLCFIPETCTYIDEHYAKTHHIVIQPPTHLPPIAAHYQFKTILGAGFIVPPQFTASAQSFAFCKTVDGECPTFVKCAAPDSSFTLKQVTVPLTDSSAQNFKSNTPRSTK